MAAKVTKPAKKAPKRGAKAYKLPEPIQKGEVLTDSMKNQWILGHSIGIGGFGEIYCAAPSSGKTPKDYSNVIKIEPHQNGPLFVEMHFYMRNAKPEDINAWKKEKKLSALGMPRYISSGSHEYNQAKYRFVVMDRYGMDLSTLFQENNKRFPEHTVYKIALQIIDVLEYIHHRTYVHADIKGGNLLLDLKDPDQVYLVDFGLACRYTTKPNYELDPKKAHNGTIEYTSRDAHMGVPTMRGDMEILAYNVIHWLCSTLPWEKNLTAPTKVQQQKEKAFEDTSQFLKTCFPESVPEPVEKYMSLLSTMKFNEVPDYKKFKKILVDGLKKLGHEQKGKLEFKMSTTNSVTPKTMKTNKRKIIDRPVLKPRVDGENGTNLAQNKELNDSDAGTVIDVKRGRMQNVKQVLKDMNSDEEYDIKIVKKTKPKPKPKAKAKYQSKSKLNRTNEPSSESEEEIISRGTRTRAANRLTPSSATKNKSATGSFNVTASSEDMFDD